MKERLYGAFDAVRAGDGMKARVLEGVKRRRRGAWTSPRRLVPAVACLLVLVLGLAGCGVYFTPTASITIRVNPEVELGVNRFDTVISARGVNGDGAALMEELDVRFLNYREAVDAILESETVSALLAGDREADIVVTCGDRRREDDMVAAVAGCTGDHARVRCSGSHGQHHGRSGQTQTPTQSQTPVDSAAPTQSTGGGHHGWRGGHHHGWGG